jgi:hypothetical protein
LLLQDWEGSLPYEEEEERIEGDMGEAVAYLTEQSVSPSCNRRRQEKDRCTEMLLKWDEGEKVIEYEGSS